jgi:hypothetical protein
MSCAPVEVEEDRVVVRLDRRSHNPILRAAALDREAPECRGYRIDKSTLSIRKVSPCEVIWPRGNRRQYSGVKAGGA